jgi:LuxR family transcriptional regulator, maltose regulon positive regulatory protein
MHLHNANLLAAERDFQASLHLAQQHGLRVVVAVNHFGLGMIAGARHQLDQAETHYLAVLADPQLYNGRYAVGSLIRLLYIYTFQGRPERARPLVDRVKEQAQLLGLRYLHDHVAALEAYLAMACGDLPRALSWVMSGLDDPLDTTMYNAADRIPVTRIRILLAEGSPASLHNANQILRKLIRYQESQHYRYFLGEVFVLQALVWAKLGRQEVALGALSEAVQRLLPNGVIGLFLEQGEPMRRLLYELSKQGHYRQLVDLLLAAFPTAEQVAPIAPGEGVITPLTDREQDVLYLLADRLSNKEIADRLVISVNTVRNHRMNILSKLQAHNRLEAVERARALGLLPLR